MKSVPEETYTIQYGAYFVNQWPHKRTHRQFLIKVAERKTTDNTTASYLDYYGDTLAILYWDLRHLTPNKYEFSRFSRRIWANTRVKSWRYIASIGRLLQPNNGDIITSSLYRKWRMRATVNNYNVWATRKIQSLCLPENFQWVDISTGVEHADEV